MTTLEEVVGVSEEVFLDDLERAIVLKSKEYVVSADLAAFGEAIIREKHIDVIPARIKYVLVYPHIAKTVPGRCITANAIVKLFGDCDYVILMSGALWESLPREEQAKLMHHELLHALPVLNEKKNEWDFKIREHDVQDFSEIIDAYGRDWKDALRSGLELEEGDPLEV